MNVSLFYSQDYGEVPEYLLQRHEEEQRAQEVYDKFLKEQKGQANMKSLSDGERQDILEVIDRMAARWRFFPPKQHGILLTFGNPFVKKLLEKVVV